MVDVWRIPLDDPGLPHDALSTALDPEERIHAEHMRVGGREWAAAHGARRLILARYLGVPAGALRFTKEASGKPRLAGVRGLEFSFARTEGLALLAVASDRPVGVDVERENDRTDVEVVAREFLQPADAAAVEWAAPDQRRTAFFAAWARHEARLKLLGRGLTEEAPEPSPDRETLVMVRALAAGPGYAAAVAAEGGSWTVRLREFSLPILGD